MTVTVRNRRGEEVEVDTYTATEAKNSFGEMLDRAVERGIVVVTRHDKPRAVVLSMQEYEAIAPRAVDPLEILRDEFDALVQRMQAPAAAAAGRALFEASPQRLGSAAKAAVRGRR